MIQANYFHKVQDLPRINTYWRKFIVNFSYIVPPLHALTSVKQVFQWGGKQHKSFKTLKENISNKPVLALPGLQQLFAIQADASIYVVGEVLMQRDKTICYHFDMFTQDMIKYPTYCKELYVLVQTIKKWKHYLMGKETIIHINHQPL